MPDLSAYGDLALTGDPPKVADYPSVSGVWDVDSIGLVGVLFGVGAVVFAIGPVHEGTGIAYGMTVGLAAAMGLQAAVARRIAVKDVTTVVVTSTITGLAADSRLGAGLEQPWMRRSGAVLLIGLGAGVGAIRRQPRRRS